MRWVTEYKCGNQRCVTAWKKPQFYSYVDTYTYNTSGLAVLNTLDKAETCLTMSACPYTSTSCMSHLLRAKGKYTGGWGRGNISIQPTFHCTASSPPLITLKLVKIWILIKFGQTLNLKFSVLEVYKIMWSCFVSLHREWRHECLQNFSLEF